MNYQYRNDYTFYESHTYGVISKCNYNKNKALYYY